MLRLEEVHVCYGPVAALWGVSFAVEAGEIVALVGANGAGKTTTLRTISGLLRPASGRVLLDGEPLEREGTSAIVERGVVQVPEGRKLFPEMSVRDNLLLGGFARTARPHQRERLGQVYALFPQLRARERQVAGTLSGGEQQMVAIGRGLMAGPRLLMLDEPSLGLAPIMVEEMFRVIVEINRAGVTVLLVEQNTEHALAIATRGFVLESGRIVLAGTGAELLANERVREAYLGM
ncbi:MAG TPA: ABC transporter ATP-binding protein [Anaeromyxobacteraceae bacterium]|nr:ABC transporter ATP-binding protein [Anaeromyxobacteraceae bacterium]